MCVYLRAKFKVSSIILTSFRQGVVLLPPPTLQNEPLKSQPKLGLNKLTSKYGKECPNFSRVVIFPFILINFSFISNATNFFIHSLNIHYLKTAFALLVFLNQVPFLFFVYADLSFKCFLTGLGRKPF